ncbi:hypothetical protein LSH36_207g04018 [Paralvinella palmiformis]|uniref:N-acetyltransferase domain-containing protein n=1 Tax=Paralvinella palmiformis TaxID=53620 RepID=A0AAD9JNX0_9ANNE|nr:hypothetical protein LSH36_207g04018 [Paralvinella palmiformis]
MKINQFTRIHGQKVIFVPYEACHVSKYHGWLMSDELQKLTGSEPLTLQQEYDMQKSWREDDNKVSYQGKGLGKESLLIMILYGSQKLHMKRVTAKIGLMNIPSIQLFTQVGFSEISRSDVFQEVTYELVLSPTVIEWFQTEVGNFVVKEGENNQT